MEIIATAAAAIAALAALASVIVTVAHARSQARDDRFRRVDDALREYVLAASRASMRSADDVNAIPGLALALRSAVLATRDDLPVCERITRMARDYSAIGAEAEGAFIELGQVRGREPEPKRFHPPSR